MIQLTNKINNPNGFMYLKNIILLYKDFRIFNDDQNIQDKLNNLYNFICLEEILNDQMINM
jgi:hypothetical protein